MEPNMIQPSGHQIIKDVLEQGVKTDPLNTIQFLIPILKDLVLTEQKQTKHDLYCLEEYSHVLYQIVKELDAIKSFIGSKGLDGSITKEINDFLGDKLSSSLIKERLEMLVFNNTIKQGKKKIGAYVSNVYYLN